MKLNKPLFPLGQVVATPGAIDAAKEADISLNVLIRRHNDGDDGDLSDEDREANKLALKDGSRIFSSYVLPKTGDRIWVITEADRSSTCCLTPEDY
jgi:hypothetical protein